MPEMIDIFPETKELYSAIHEINVLAFGQENEARLVDNLRKSCSFDRHYPAWLLRRVQRHRSDIKKQIA